MTLEDQRAQTVNRLQAYARTLQDRPAAAAWVLISNLAGALVDSLQDQAAIMHEQVDIIRDLGTVLADQSTRITALQADLAEVKAELMALTRIVTNGDTEGG